MKAFGNRFIRVTRRVSALLLALIVVLFISSCSDEGMKLCRVNLDTGSISRQLDAIVNTSEIDQDFLIYYKAIYKGTGTAYGDMSTESKYKLLGTEGILLSQGLWKIDVLLTNKIANTTPASEVEKSDLTNPLEGSTGDVFVNLNTNTFRVTIGQGSGTGSIWFTYSLRNVTNYNFDLSFFALRDTFERITIDGFELTHPNTEENDKFISGSNNKQKEYSLPTGIYYAVVTITNKTTSNVIFTDSIGFVIKKDVLTKLDGHYHHNTSNSSIINVSKNPGTDSSGSSTAEDIKEWGGNEFTDGGTYKIVEESYTFVCSEQSNRNKVLEDKTVTIDLNGNQIVNAYVKNAGGDSTTKTYFTVAQGSLLSLINHGGSPSIYGFNTQSTDIVSAQPQHLKALALPSFVVDSGTFIIGDDDDNNGHITITGCPAYVPVDDRHAAIEITEKGGSIKLDGGTSNQKGILIKDAVKCISSISSSDLSTLALGFNVNIELNNSSLYSSGYGKKKKDTIIDNNYGIYLNGQGKSGVITITLSGTDSYVNNQAFDSNIYPQIDTSTVYTISTSGSSDDFKGYGIRIDDFKGTINITLTNGAKINSADGYGIYLSNCDGSINIETQSGTSINGKTNAIYVDNESSGTVNLKYYGDITGGISIKNKTDFTKGKEYSV